VNVAELVRISIILLLVATVVALLSRRLRVPYVTGLVLAGLAIAELLPEPIGLSDSLILNLFLPILVFEAAINTDISRLRSNVKPIAMLAGPGIAIASGVTATLLKWKLGLDWTPALFAGVILAITDTVSVIAAFKEVAVPSRLSTIVEGESLFNDGVALVIFSLILQVHETGSLSFADGFREFFITIIGGTLIGLGIGYLSSGLFVRSDEPLSSILLTIAVALGVFQLAQSLQVSGVVAVVVAGLIVGTSGLSSKVSASTRLVLLSFWESIAFGVNSFIFLIVGLEVDLMTFWRTLPAVLMAILAYQIGRIVSVYPLLAMLRWFDRPIPWRWQHVLFLGNIKGSLSMALVLSLPMTLEARPELVAIVFGTVLLSLVGQGLSLPWLVKKLNLRRTSVGRQKVEGLQAQLITAKAARDELDGLLNSGVLPKALYEEMRSTYQVQIVNAEKALRIYYNRRPEVLDSNSDNSQLDGIRRRLLLAEKGALSEAMRRGILSEEAGREQLRAIDKQLLQLDDD